MNFTKKAFLALLTLNLIAGLQAIPYRYKSDKSDIVNYVSWLFDADKNMTPKQAFDDLIKTCEEMNYDPEKCTRCITWACQYFQEETLNASEKTPEAFIKCIE